MGTTIEELGTFLATGGIGTQGTDLFLGGLDSTPVTQCALVPYPGAAPELAGDGTGVVAIEFPRFQFLSRAETMSEALSKAQDAFALLAPVANQLLSGTFYRSINVSQSPGLLYYEANSPICGFNFECEKEPS